MGQERPQSEYDRTRRAFVAAARNLAVAMNAWIELEVPLYAKTGGRRPGWTAEQAKATDVAAAWQELYGAAAPTGLRCAPSAKARAADVRLRR